MGQAATLVLAAGALAATNEIVFAPAADASTYTSHFNWRIVPATGALALMFSGVEKAAPGFAVGLSALVLLAVMIVPVGNAPSPVENISKSLGLG